MSQTSKAQLSETQGADGEGLGVRGKGLGFRV